MLGISSFPSDLRQAVRVLRRAPAFALLCVATLALAIGPIAAIFSVVDAVLIQPLPYSRPDRLAFIHERDANGQPVTTGYATLQDIRQRATLLENVAAVGGWQTTLTDPSRPERLDGARVTWNYFRTLGVATALGRDFAQDEDRPLTGTATATFPAGRVVILTHGLWASRFGADSGLIGRNILLDGVANTVVGVLPTSFDDVQNPTAEIYRPLGYAADLPWGCRTCRHLTAIARIRDGVPRVQALAQLNGISRQLVAAYPKEYPAAGMFLEPMQARVTRSARPALMAIAAAVLLVLLIAAANVMNLQLARSIRRADEFAVRTALGAGAARLAQQLMAEGLVIALAGGALGLLLGRATLPALIARLPQSLPRIDAIHLDARIAFVVAAIVCALAIALGVIPALGAHTRVAFTSLRGGSRVGDGVSRHRARATLVASEIALAMLLLAGAGLLAKSLTRLLAVDPGFDPAHLATMATQSDGPRYATTDAVLQYHDRILAAARQVPGVEVAALTTAIPLGGIIDRFGIETRDHPLANPALAPYATGYRVAGDYLGAMHIRVVAGRAFTAEDERDSLPSVAIVSASLARVLFGSESPIGKMIHVPNARAPWTTIVGVAHDVRHERLDGDDGHAFYMPEREWLWAADMVLVARTAGDAAPVMRSLRSAVATVDPTQPITDVRTMESVERRSTAQRQLALTLFAAFAILALLLSAAGIYGVLAGTVAERTREIGMRSALGATRRDLIRLVLARGLGLTGVGVGIGLIGAMGVTRFLKSLLYGVAPTDPFMLGAAAAVLCAVAIMACLVPARRATRIDPMVALRE